MNGSVKLYVELVKNEMIETLESGSIRDPMQQYKYIDTVLQRFLLLNIENVNKAIVKYFEDQKKVKDDMEKAMAEYQKHLDVYADNCKNIYEEIKKL